MRILFLHHFPLSESAIGRRILWWAGALVDAGHDARILVVDNQRRDDERLIADRILCRAGDPAADLSFDLPRFSTPAGNESSHRFAALSDTELAEYRAQLRHRLDTQVYHFNPDVIHPQHAWIFGQLTVETGVPYVLSIWGPELADCQHEPRYRALAEQAAANAGRILAPDAATLDRLERIFEVDPGRAIVAPAALNPVELDEVSSNRAEAAAELVRLYQTLLDERFGTSS